MKKIFYILIGALMLAGCSKELADEPNTTAKPGEHVAVTFGASVSGEASEMSAMQGAENPASRAFTSAYTGRIAVLGSSNNWAVNCDNIPLTISSAGSMTAAPAIVTSGQSYSFHSVAVLSGMTLPPLNADNYTLVFNKESDGTDLIYAKTTTQTINGGEKITFAYNHVYGKVKFVLTKGDYITDAQLATATLKVSGYYSSGVLNMKTGAITGTAGTNVAVERDIVYYALPQTFATGSEATAMVTIGTKTYSGKITAGNITADKLTTVTITVDVEPPPAKIGSYYYSDGSSSDVFALPSGATLLGVVYEVNGIKGKLIEVQEGELGWGSYGITTNATNMTNGQANMATIKALDSDFSDYHAFKRCADKNAGGATDWYLPAKDELSAFYAAYKRYGGTAFNKLMTASGVNGTAIYTEKYWSSSENTSFTSWYISFEGGGMYSYDKTSPTRVRCIRVF